MFKQDLVELVLIAKKGEIGDNEGKDLAHLLVQYAQLLASQGDLSTAVLYLGDSQEVILFRLYVNIDIHL